MMVPGCNLLVPSRGPHRPSLASSGCRGIYPQSPDNPPFSTLAPPHAKISDPSDAHSSISPIVHLCRFFCSRFYCFSKMRLLDFGYLLRGHRGRVLFLRRPPLASWASGAPAPPVPRLPRASALAFLGPHRRPQLLQHHQQLRYPRGLQSGQLRTGPFLW